MDRRARIKELREKRAAAWDQAKTLLDRAYEGDGLVGEVREQYEKADADVDSFDRQLQAEQRMLDAEIAAGDERAAEHDALERGGEHEAAEAKRSEEYSEVFARFMQNGAQALEPDDRSVLARGRVNDPTETRAQGVAVAQAGGFLVPDSFQAQIHETLLAYGAPLAVVNVITTATGNDIEWPTNDDTANKGAILGENTQISEQDVTFGIQSIGAYTYTSKLVRVSYQFLQDAVVDAQAFLGRKFGQRLGRIHADHFTTGTGSNQPLGLVTGSTSGKTAAAADDIEFDELIDLMHSIDPAYRGTNGQFMFNDTTLALLRKKKEEDASGTVIGGYIWQPSTREGQPDRILGQPYTVNQAMPAPTASNKAVLYGDFRSYYVARRVAGYRLVRLDERYADYLQVGFFAFDRMDGAVDDSNAVKALTMHS